MNQFFKRLLHSIKVTGGGFLTKYLRTLFLKNEGSVSRLCQVLSEPQISNTQLPDGYTAKVLIAPVTLPKCEPQFYVSGSNEKIYLEKLAHRGEQRTQPAGIISAENVSLSLPIGMHFWKRKVFEDALLGKEILTNPKYVLDLETIPFKSKQKCSEAVLLSLPWHHNFYHWMIEILPRVMLYDLAENVHKLKLVLPQSSPRFVKDSLELTGYTNRASFFEDGVYSFEKLHILSRLSKTSNVAPAAIEWLNRKVPATQVQGKKRIYVSRADAKIRYVTNELEVQDMLSSEFGFETVLMSQYPLKEQVKLFQQAEIAIGSHGAAFAHIAFMAPGTKFIEFFELGHFNHCFYRIASIRKLKYGFLVGQKNGLGFSIDIDTLKKVVRQALL